MLKTFFDRLLSKREKLRSQRAVRPNRRFKLLVETLENRLVPSATLATDQPDYHPGETVLISGAGFQVGETVQFQVANVTNGNVYTPPWSVTDGGTGDMDGLADGNLQTSWVVCLDAADSTLQLTGVGDMGDQASVTFADGAAKGRMTGTNGDSTTLTAFELNQQGPHQESKTVVANSSNPVVFTPGISHNTQEFKITANAFSVENAPFLYWTINNNNNTGTTQYPTLTLDYTGSDLAQFDTGDATFIAHYGDAPPPNHAPVANPDSYDCVNVNAAYSGTSVLANDSDPDGDAITAVQDTAPAHGSLTLNADGTFTYTPDASYFNGLGKTGSHPTDSFTYHAFDGSLGSDVVTVTLTLNRAPVAAAESFSAMMNVSNSNLGNVLNNDSDPDGTLASEEVMVTGVTGGTGAWGTITVSSSGVVGYAAAGNDYHGTVTFSYTITDHCGLASTVNDTLTITSNAKTQGYWSTHQASIDALFVANGITKLTVGGACYTSSELVTLMKMSCGTGSGTNTILALFQQQAAARLNTLPTSTQVWNGTALVTIGGVTPDQADKDAMTGADAAIVTASGSHGSKLQVTKKNTVAWADGTTAQVVASSSLGQQMVGYIVTLTAFNQTGS